MPGLGHRELDIVQRVEMVDGVGMAEGNGFHDFSFKEVVAFLKKSSAKNFCSF